MNLSRYRGGMTWLVYLVCAILMAGGLAACVRAM